MSCRDFYITYCIIRVEADMCAFVYQRLNHDDRNHPKFIAWEKQEITFLELVEDMDALRISRLEDILSQFYKIDTGVMFLAQHLKIQLEDQFGRFVTFYHKVLGSMYAEGLKMKIDENKSQMTDIFNSKTIFQA